MVTMQKSVMIYAYRRRDLMAQTAEIFAKNLKIIRLARKLSRRKLAARVGIHKSSIDRYEAGTRQPDLNTIKALAEALHCSVADLFGEGLI